MQGLDEARLVLVADVGRGCLQQDNGGSSPVPGGRFKPEVRVGDGQVGVLVKPGSGEASHGSHGTIPHTAVGDDGSSLIPQLTSWGILSYGML